ncbi:MAG: hypothetical protein ABEJ44_07065 [Halanaeroarchaeum sp.]
MTTKMTVLGVALVGLLAFTGFAAATSGVGFAADVQAQTNDETTWPAPTAGSAADQVDRPLDGSNSPWVTGDERLDLFQDRFNLTDEQVTDIRTEVQSMIEDGATREEIRATVTEMLASYGVANPTLGPPADGRLGAGPFGQGTGDGTGFGGGPGAGPHGPADGSCLR